MEFIKKIDHQLLKWVYQGRIGKYLPKNILIFMGDAPFWMIVLFIAALAGQIFKVESFIDLSLLLILGMGIGSLLFSKLKQHIPRKRPYANPELHEDLGIQIINHDPGHGSKELESFPSGHVYWTTISVGLLCYQFGSVAAIASGWMILVMMYLRPYLGVHYPSDSFAGLLLGGIIVVVTLTFAPALLEYVSTYKNNSGYMLGYWSFVILCLYSGYRSWRKRV